MARDDRDGERGEVVKEFKTELRDLVNVASEADGSLDWFAEVDRQEQELLRRYELAQRARARNLVGLLCAVAERSNYRRQALLAGRADRIAAKYLGGNSQ